MKKFLTMLAIVSLLFNVFLFVGYAQSEDEISTAVNNYFDELFNHLKEAAGQNPNKENFREIMRPLVEETEGVYGATLIDPQFVIRQVYFPSHFLARGFDLKKVEELKDFYRMMRENPAPQLSEPQKLIAMRYPVVKDGKLVNIVSMMTRTKSFLKATGLDKYRAFRIICSGKLAAEKGKLPEDYKEVTIELPSTEWVIQYEK